MTGQIEPSPRTTASEGGELEARPLEPVESDGAAQLDAPGSQDPYPGEARTRLSGAWTGLVAGILALVVILVFILQNQQGVELTFLSFHGSLPLAVALLLAATSGAVLVLGFGGARILQLRRVAKRARQSR
jgi:uncharacterized integral membrane protein